MQLISLMMTTPDRKQYAGPSPRFSTLREAAAVSSVLIPIGTAVLLLTACVSPSREGLPPGTPFTDHVELQKPSLPEGTAVGDISSHSAQLWLRTDGSKHIQIEWASADAWKTLSAMASVQSAAARTPSIVTGPETDFTLTLSLEPLASSTRYRYYVWVSEPDA